MHHKTKIGSIFGIVMMADKNIEVHFATDLHGQQDHWEQYYSQDRNSEGNEERKEDATSPIKTPTGKKNTRPQRTLYHTKPNW